MLEGHRDHRAKCRTALYDGNESNGQGQVQGVGRIDAPNVRRFDHYGATDFDLDRREEQNSVSGVIHFI